MLTLITSVPEPTTSERIEFFALPHASLQDLLQPSDPTKLQFFTCDPQHACQGTLAVEFSENIGVGTFKTTHLGHLSLFHVRPEGLGNVPNHLVAAKRMYVKWKKNADPHSSTIGRHPAADEYALTVQEANLLYWASSLMGFTYSFIHHAISQAATKPPFDIPELRFVHAGVAVAHDQVSGRRVADASSVHRTFLLEELIDTETEEFVKFIHNGSALPLLDPVDPLYKIAEFLCFTQHVQYLKSDGAVFLSDLQGTWTFKMTEMTLIFFQAQKLCSPTRRS